MAGERRQGIPELVKRIEQLEESSNKTHNAWHETQKDISDVKTNQAVQGEQISQIVKTGQKIELGLWGKDGQGGFLGEIKTIREEQAKLKGWAAGFGSFFGLLGGILVGIIRKGS